MSNETTNNNFIGKIQTAPIEEEMKKSYLDYAMSVIVARALPDTRDGLKPVHRRILYAMLKIGLSYPAKHTKSAKVVGETLGKFHPHGDMPVYDALVRLAQDFSMRYPLINGQGNFGSVDGDQPAAMRYTEVRLAKIAKELLEDIDKNTVDFVDNFDGTIKEPVFLPAKIPNLLLMGSDGIAVGMATKIPPHNLHEIIEAILFMLKEGKIIRFDSLFYGIKKITLDKVSPLNTALATSFESQVSIEDLLQFIKGPDFPTGGAIYNKTEIFQAYASGRGKILVRGIADIEEVKGEKYRIVISEIPYQVNKASLVARIADLIREKKINGAGDLRDESDREGMRVVLELKKNAKPKAILNSLYKYTQLQTSFPVNMVALVEGVPQTLNLKQILEEFIRHRQKVVTKRTIFELEMAKKRAHILEGLKICLDHLDEVIETIKKSPDAEAARGCLMEKFKLSEIQAEAILELQLRRLAALERKKIEDEYKEVNKLIDYLSSLLKAPEKILTVIAEELRAIQKDYADERRTKVYAVKLKDFSEADLIPAETCIILTTKTGYIKRLPLGTYKSQRRGGKGVTGMATKETDEIQQIFTANTHDLILFFTNKGRVFVVRAWDLPEGSRQAKGQAVINLINIDQDEQVQSILNLPANFKESQFKYLFMATDKGTVKKTSLSEFENIRQTGKIAIKLEKGDSLKWVKPTTGNYHILLVTHHGKSIRFNEQNVRPMGRNTAGVMGIRLQPGDGVVGMEAFDPKFKPSDDKRKKYFRDILIITEKGLGKRTNILNYPVQKRAGQGVKAAKITAKSGKIISCQLVTEQIEQILITSKKAQVIKLPLKNISRLGRDTQGVILMRFSKKDDSVAAVTCIEQQETIQ